MQVAEETNVSRMASDTPRGAQADRMQQSKKSKIAPRSGSGQLPSFVLFASVIILINLCPFQTDFEEAPARFHTSISQRDPPTKRHADSYLSYLQTSMDFVKLMFHQPLRLNRRVTRVSLAEARVLGKMAKVWYIKKKIKKLSKKLRKHTIAVPVFTAIPIYEHSYYPQPHLTHVSHGGMHQAAASTYASAALAQASPTTAASTQQLATSASSHHPMAYRVPQHRAHTGGGYQQSASAHHIINAYAPSPPLFVDDTGGLYGHYGNAYGRYDGGYHVW